MRHAPSPPKTDQLITDHRSLITTSLLILGSAVALLALIGLIGLLVGPSLLTDQALLERHLQSASPGASPSLPGFAHPLVLSRQPGSTNTHRTLRVQVDISTPAGPLTCRGLLIYHHDAPPASDLAWDADQQATCSEAEARVHLARQILAGGSIRHSYDLYGKERTDQVIHLLRLWLAADLLRPDDIPGADNRNILESGK